MNTDIECYNIPSKLLLLKKIEHIVDGDFDGASSVHSADVNGNGNMDVLGAASSAGYIAWWDLNSFNSNGLLESIVLNVQESPFWESIDWTSTEPSGTDVAFHVRASDDPLNMGVWSDTLAAPCDLVGLLTDGDSYFQYRAILTTTDSLVSPVLDDVLVTWNPTDIGGESGTDDVYALYGIQPNPSFGSTTLLFSLPVNSPVELTEYDLSGRLVQSISGEYEAGVHEVVLEDLACGVYLARMTSEDFKQSQQFVVTR